MESRPYSAPSIRRRRVRRSSSDRSGFCAGPISSSSSVRIASPSASPRSESARTDASVAASLSMPSDISRSDRYPPSSSVRASSLPTPRIWIRYWSKKLRTNRSGFRSSIWLIQPSWSVRNRSVCASLNAMTPLSA